MMSAPVLLPCGAGEDSTWQLQDLRVQRHARAHDGHAPLPRPQGALRRTRLQCRPTRIKTYTIDNSSTAVWAWHIAMHTRGSVRWSPVSLTHSQLFSQRDVCTRLQHGSVSLQVIGGMVGLLIMDPSHEYLQQLPADLAALCTLNGALEVYFCCRCVWMRKCLPVRVLQRPLRRANEPVLLRAGAAAPQPRPHQ